MGLLCGHQFNDLQQDCSNCVSYFDRIEKLRRSELPTQRESQPTPSQSSTTPSHAHHHTTTVNSPHDSPHTPPLSQIRQSTTCTPTSMPHIPQPPFSQHSTFTLNPNALPFHPLPQPVVGHPAHSAISPPPSSPNHKLQCAFNHRRPPKFVPPNFSPPRAPFCWLCNIPSFYQCISCSRHCCRLHISHTQHCGSCTSVSATRTTTTTTTQPTHLDLSHTTPDTMPPHQQSNQSLPHPTNFNPVRISSSAHARRSPYASAHPSNPNYQNPALHDFDQDIYIGEDDYHSSGFSSDHSEAFSF